MMMSARRDGDSLSATAHKLMSPTSRKILLIFIFFYLLVIAGAFGNLVSGVLASRATVPLGIVVLALAGLLGGQMLYKWKLSLTWTTLVTGRRHLRRHLARHSAGNQRTAGPHHVT